jgi:hypothetical protein
VTYVGVEDANALSAPDAALDPSVPISIYDPYKVIQQKN